MPEICGNGIDDDCDGLTDFADFGDCPCKVQECFSAKCPWGYLCAPYGCCVPHCFDGIVNGSESDVDCGGACAPCAPGQNCYVNFDCTSGVCVNHICGPFPVSVGDTPGGGTGAVNALGLRSANPMRSGEARLAFTLAATEKVEVKIYGVSGRLIRTVAHRVFEGGKEHVVTWDGASDNGDRVSPGTYFYRVRSASFDGHRKIIVLN